METVSVLLLIANILIGVGLIRFLSEVRRERAEFAAHQEALRNLMKSSEDSLRLRLETERRVIEGFHETAREKMQVDRADINNTRKSFLLEVAKVAQARRIRA